MIHVTLFTNRKDLSEWQLRQIKEDFKDLVFIWNLDAVTIVNNK